MSAQRLHVFCAQKKPSPRFISRFISLIDYPSKNPSQYFVIKLSSVSSQVVLLSETMLMTFYPFIQSTNAAQNGHHYAQQSYKNSGDSALNGGHGQYGSYIPAIPAMAALVANGTPASLPPRHLNKKTNALYKTEMCRNWNEIGECRYGRSCQFAHGKKELRTVPRHGQWKTKTCMAWLHGGCTYGSRCCYARKSFRMIVMEP